MLALRGPRRIDGDGDSSHRRAGAGNTGSHLLPHLARMAQVAKLTLVDPDVYTAENLRTQNIDGRDAGLPKVAAQAEKLRRINPGLDVVCAAEAVEDVPRGCCAAT